jgi:hypothetical protein
MLIPNYGTKMFRNWPDFIIFAMRGMSDVATPTVRFARTKRRFVDELTGKSGP